MSITLEKIRALVDQGYVWISDHGYDELADDGLTAREVVRGVAEYTLVEDYPNFGKGPRVLTLHRDNEDNRVHAVWGIPVGRTGPKPLGRRLPTEAVMARKRTKLIHEGDFVAEVDIELLEEGDGWSPCLSTADAYRLDDVREALRTGNLSAAA
ncbi:MAG: DUF4258 domain-containing protein [Chromatiales bacterium]|nr:DUF4258 domain-containing protein [Chromatiales bacterium]